MLENKFKRFEKVLLKGGRLVGIVESMHHTSSGWIYSVKFDKNVATVPERLLESASLSLEGKK